MEVIVAHEKSTAHLRTRPRSNCSSGGLTTGTGTTRKTQMPRKAALDSGDEAVAWKFLRSRRDYEYEYVEKQSVK